VNKILRIRNILIGGILVLLISIGLELQDVYRKYGNFRTTQDPIVSTERVDLTGLRDLHMAGGPMLPLHDLKKRLATAKTNIIIVNGTIGKHGYVNGTPTTDLGYLSKNPGWRYFLWRLFSTGTIKAHPELVISEAEEAKKHGFEYKSFLIGSKFNSAEKTIDEFVTFIDSLPENTSVYFHCHHGKGRTSLMLVMADIIKNAPNVALTDIIKRQYLLGSVDLFDTIPWSKGTYSTATLEKRKTFVQTFYAFICQRKTGGIQLWSEWNRNQHADKVRRVSQDGTK